MAADATPEPVGATGTVDSPEARRALRPDPQGDRRRADGITEGLAAVRGEAQGGRDRAQCCRIVRRGEKQGHRGGAPAARALLYGGGGPLQPIKDDPAAVQTALDQFAGQVVYVHAELIPGGFLRNMRVSVQQAYLRGGGSCRVALRCEGDAWVRMEDLTHWEVDTEGRLIFCAFGDEQQRLSRTLEISNRPFPA